MLTVALSAESARAGEYLMRNCNVPGQPISSAHPWQLPESNDFGINVVDGCATGDGIKFDFSQAHEIDAVRGISMHIARPTGVRSAIKLEKVVLWYTTRLTSSGQKLSFYTRESRLDGSIITGSSTDQSVFENMVGERQLSSDAASYSVGLSCGPLPEGPNCSVPAGTALAVRGMEVTLSEDVPPLVSRPGGSLMEAGPQSGVRTLTYSGSDVESGLRKVDVMLGDTVVQSLDLTQRCAYADFTVCPASDGEMLDVDTRAVPNGSYELAVRIQDAAGNERTVHGHRPIEIVNEPPSKVTNVTPFRLDARFTGTSQSTVIASYGQRVSVRGRLGQGSEPVTQGTPIDVLERLDRRGARERRTRTVLVKADGSFSIGLATSRPSRVVRLAYRPVGGGLVVSKALRLRVRSASRVQATLRGRIVRFRGRIVSGPVPKGGKRVQMEGRSPGSSWTPFKNLRTDGKGRFSGTYRLRVRRPGVVLNVRAVVPSEKGYGYLSSRSRSVKLRVR